MAMLDWWKKRRAAADKREATEIGARHVEIFNAALEDWRSTSLNMRRTMLEDVFTERLVEIQPDGELDFEETARIEALALLANWVENTPTYVGEFMDRLPQETIDIFDMLGIGDEAAKHVNRHVAETRALLELELDRTIDEAIVMRQKLSNGS